MSVRHGSVGLEVIAPSYTSISHASYAALQYSISYRRAEAYETNGSTVMLRDKA